MVNITGIYSQSKITDVAKVDNQRITLYENFNQFLWSICYVSFVIFDEALQKPILEERFTGKIDFSNEYISRAIALFDQSFSLFGNYDPNDFYLLPNPERYSVAEEYYITRTNTIFTTAMVFILLHEFGHKYYSHTEYESNELESIKEEFDVDDFAFDKMSEHFNVQGAGYKLGIVMAIGTLIFLDNTLKGGKGHPDPDHRFRKLIERMDLTDLDNIWGISSVLFELWGIRHKREMRSSLAYENYKEMFYDILNRLDDLKPL